MKQVNFWLSG